MKLSEIIRDLEKWEGRYPYLYQDVKGYVTIGIGNLVKTEKTAIALPLMVGERAATKEEKIAAFNAVKAAPKKMRAPNYAKFSIPRLSEAGLVELTESRLQNEFLPGLRNLYEGFDGFPAKAQTALLDMAWNMGVAKLEEFKNLGKAVSRRDWDAAARACHRKTCRPERNDWTANLFKTALDP